MKDLQAIEIQLNETPDKQVSLTDSDARTMMTRSTGIVGYNVPRRRFQPDFYNLMGERCYFGAV